MALAGTAFLALLNDFEPDRDREYNRWHSREHVPERLTVPGIVSARRYVNRDEQQYPYFTLYEMESTATMLSEPYLRLLGNPTPWTARMRTGFRQFHRVPCRTLVSVSDGVGAATRLILLTAPESPPAASDAVPWREICAGLASLDGMVGAHVGQQDHGLPGPPVAAAMQASSVMPGTPPITFALVIEALEAACLADAANAREIGRILSAATSGAQGTPLRIESARDYTLMHVLTRA